MQPGHDRIYQGDVLDVLKTWPDNFVNCCVTSPPYWGLRDYGVRGQLGLEKTPQEYVEKMVTVFREVRRVLRDDGTLWLNLGDSYNAAGRIGHGTREGFKQNTNRASANRQDSPRPSDAGLKEKDLVGIPWRVAFALQADGWYLRQDIIWSKPNPMPESVTDRCTKAHEYIFMLSKNARYYYNADAIKEPQVTPAGCKSAQTFGAKNGKAEAVYGAKVSGDKWKPSGLRNKRSVWTVTTKPFKGAHFATFPQDLIEPCVLAGAPTGGIVLDPFMGAGTTAVVASKLGRIYIGCELNPEYIQIAHRRLGAELW